MSASDAFSWGVIVGAALVFVGGVIVVALLKCGALERWKETMSGAQATRHGFPASLPASWFGDESEDLRRCRERCKSLLERLKETEDRVERSRDRVRRQNQELDALRGGEPPGTASSLAQERMFRNVCASLAAVSAERDQLSKDVQKLSQRITTMKGRCVCGGAS